MKKYDGKVRVVYKNFVVHPDTATDAHLAACAASKQGKFKDFKNAFWEKGFGAYMESRDASKMSRENVVAIAKEVGLDTSKLETDMEACKPLLKSDMDEMSKFGVNGTPSFFVNGKFTMFSGPGPFMALIDAELAEVEKSGIPADQYYQKVVIEQGEKTFKSAAGK